MPKRSRFQKRTPPRPPECQRVGAGGNGPAVGGRLVAGGRAAVEEYCQRAAAIAAHTAPPVTPPGAALAAGGANTQALAAGQIDLGRQATLSLSLVSGYTPAVGDKFFLLDETTQLLLVQGTFADVPLTNSTLTVGSTTFQINYLDSDPNDPSRRLGPWSLAGLLGCVAWRRRHRARLA